MEGQMVEIPLIKFEDWTPRPVADPRRASPAQFMDGMSEILQVLAPIQALDLFQTYAKAGGLMKITASVRSRFERVILQAAKDGIVEIERENDSEVEDDKDPRCWIVRLKEQDRVKMRTLGPRSFAEVPLSELAAFVLELRCADEFMGKEEIARAILTQYGLQKLTALVQRRLDRVFAEYF